MHKRCFRCNKELPLDDFYRHKAMADGRLGKCKNCTKTDVAENYRKRRDYYAEYERQRFKDKGRKERIAEYQRRRRERHPLRYAAWYAVSNAVRDGRIEKLPCNVCGKEPAQAHHADYAKPLEVIWLCRKHHLEEHGKQAY